MRRFLVLAVLSGCATSGAERDAREQQISCLDHGIEMQREAQRQREVLFQWQESAIPCDVRAAYGLDVPANCANIKEGTRKLSTQLSALDLDIEQNRVSCEAWKYRADDLHDERARRAEALSAAAQAYGDALNNVAAIQASAPRRQPTSCSTVMIGNTAQTNCY